MLGLSSALFPASPLSVMPGYGPARYRRSWRKSSRYYTPNGKREVARRLRQIEKGQLKVSK